MFTRTPMITRMVPAVALGMLALGASAVAGVEPMVLGARQMDGVTASAAPAVQAEPIDRRTPVMRAGENAAAPALSAASDSNMARSPAGGAMMTPGDGLSPFAFGSDIGTGGAIMSDAFSDTVSDGGTAMGGGIRRLVTSSGPGTTATSSASALGAGMSSVFVSSSTTTIPAAPAMPSTSSSFSRASSFSAR